MRFLEHMIKVSQQSYSQIVVLLNDQIASHYNYLKCWFESLIHNSKVVGKSFMVFYLSLINGLVYSCVYIACSLHIRNLSVIKHKIACK